MLIHSITDFRGQRLDLYDRNQLINYRDEVI